MIDKLTHNPGRSAMLTIMMMAALVLVLALSSALLMAQEERGAITGLTLTSEDPGEIVISWDGPQPAPSDYRISWAPSSGAHIGWQEDNQADRGNAYPEGTERSFTVTGLPAGEEYKVRMRARYNAGQYADAPWSGPWKKATITLAQEPESEPEPAPISEPTEEPVGETTPPSVTLPATTPVEGKQLTATLVDPDDLMSGESWSWSSSTTTTGTFTAITGATSATYTPVADDVGNYLRVTASYTDSPDSEQTVSVDSTGATLANPSPVFADAVVTFSVAEDTATDDAVGTVTATDPDNDTLTYSVGGTDATEFDGDFTLNATSGAITVKSDATIDHDDRSSYEVTITATDTFNRTDTVDVTVTVDDPYVVLGSIQSLTIADSASGPDQIDVSWVGPADLAADQFEIAWTFEGWEYTTGRDRSDTTQDHKYTITGVGELTAYAIRVRANFETEESGVYEHGPWLEQVHTTGAAPTPEPEPQPTTVPATARTSSNEDHITGAITLVSNNDLPKATESTTVDSETTVSQKFRTGSAQRGYTLNAVKLELTPNDGSDAAVAVAVHADAGTSYGAKLFDLTSPADLDADVDVFTAPANSVLQPNTNYWLVIKNAQGSTGDADLVLSDSTTTDDATLEGFSVSQMKVDVDDSTSTSATLEDLTPDVFSAFGGGTSGNGLGTRASPNTNTNTNVIRMVLTGQHVGDVPAGITTQAALTLGEERDGYTNFLNDSDWYRVELEAGVNYVFDAYLNDLYKPDSVWIYGVHDSSGASMSVEYVHRYVLSDYQPAGTGSNRIDFDPKGRIYFTPATAETYFLAAGVRHTKTAGYHIKYAKHDTETEATTTPASAAVGSVYQGEFFTPHGTLTAAADYDVDWVRVSLQAGENYQFLVDVPHLWTKTDILSVRDSTGAVVSTFVPGTSQPPRDDRGWWPNRSWVSANFTPTTSGIYYVEITGSGAEVHSIVPNSSPPSPRYHTKRYFGSGYDFHVWGTEQSNVDERVGSTDTLGHGTVFVDGFVNTDNTDVFGSINASSDVDWYRVWFDAGEKYMIFFDDADDRDLTVDGVWEPVKAYITGPFDPNIDYIPVNDHANSTTDCGYTTVAAEETGFHFIELSASSPIQGDYYMSVLPLDDRQTTDETTLGGDIGRCTSPGFLFPGDAAAGTLHRTDDWDTYAVWFTAGVEYQIEARGSSSGSGTVVDPVLYVQDPLGNVDESGFDQGTGNDDLWKKVATRTGLHLVHVKGDNLGPKTYSISVAIRNRIALTPLPGPMGKAVIGEELSLGSLTSLVAKLGETPTYNYQWLRDGADISRATGTTYTLTNADVGRRISVRVAFTLANTEIGSVESVATSRVIDNTGALIHNNNIPRTGYYITPQGHSWGALWLGFKTGNNANGYMLDKALVRFDGHGRFAPTIPRNQYSAHLEGTGTSSGGYRPKNDIKFQFHEISDVERGQEITVQAPTAAHLGRNEKYNIAMRETHSGGWSCQATTYRNNNAQQSGWEMRFGISGHNNPTAETHENEVSSARCKFGIFGRAIVSSNYLASIGITNTPLDGNGFDSGDTIEVTAVLTEAITGTLTMSLNIGGRIATATAEGDNTNTFVFEFVTMNSDTDDDGVTFDGNVLHGYVDADLGHTDSWANPRNGVNVPPVITDIGVTSTPNDPAVGYTTGESIDLTFTFDKPIEVTGTGIRLTMTFHDGRLDPTTCETSHWHSPTRYDSAKSTSTTMVFSVAVIDNIHDDQGWVNNNDIQLHGGAVTDGWRPAGSKINADLGYHRGGTGINYPINVDSRTACNN